jgi:hypothetical protein
MFSFEGRIHEGALIKSVVVAFLRRCDGPPLGGQTQSPIAVQVVRDLAQISARIGKEADLRVEVGFRNGAQEEAIALWGPNEAWRGGPPSIADEVSKCFEPDANSRISIPVRPFVIAAAANFPFGAHAAG